MAILQNFERLKGLLYLKLIQHFLGTSFFLLLNFLLLHWQL